MDINQQDQKPVDKKALDQAALEQFVDGLIKDRNDPKLEPEQIPQVRAVLLKQVDEAINTQLINALPEKDQAALDELLDKNPTDDELNKFFMENILNLEAEIASALLSFRAAYLYVPEQQKTTPVTPMVPVTSASSAVPPPPPPAPVMVSNLVN